MPKQSVDQADKTAVNSYLLLDTHIWLWLVTGETHQLSAYSLETIIAAKHLGVSAISVWEVGMLESKGRIQLKKSCLDWVRDALKAPRVRFLPLTPEVAVESSRLPGTLHGDPADRILVATSRLEGASLVTKDRQLQSYAQQSFLSILEA